MCHHEGQLGLVRGKGLGVLVLVLGIRIRVCRFLAFRGNLFCGAGHAREFDPVNVTFRAETLKIDRLPVAFEFHLGLVALVSDLGVLTHPAHAQQVAYKLGDIEDILDDGLEFRSITSGHLCLDGPFQLRAKRFAVSNRHGLNVRLGLEQAFLVVCHVRCRTAIAEKHVGLGSNA